MAYIGNTAASRFVSNRAASVYSGDGSTVAFTLEQVVTQDEDILVSVDGVVQEPSVGYAVSSGTTLTFSAAPSTNSGNNIFVYYLASQAGTVGHPSTQALSATVGTFSSNATVGGTLGVTGETTLSTHLNMGDNDKIKIGAGDDLEIYHDASNSYIDESGTGSLRIRSNRLRLEKHTGENMIECLEDGAVELYHNAVKKLATSAAGVTVTGEQIISVADGSIQNGLTVQGTVGGGYGGVVGWKDTWSGDSYRGYRGTLIMDVPGANAGRFRILIATSGTLTARFTIAANGDITATDTSIGAISDERLKKDITDYTYDIAKFKEYAPKTFNWKNKIAHNDRDGNIGFLAQAVNATDARWIGETEIDPTSPDYDIISDNISFTSKLGEKDAMYISVIKQLIAKVETLESKVTALENA